MISLEIKILFSPHCLIYQGTIEQILTQVNISHIFRFLTPIFAIPAILLFKYFDHFRLILFILKLNETQVFQLTLWLGFISVRLKILF